MDRSRKKLYTILFLCSVLLLFLEVVALAAFGFLQIYALAIPPWLTNHNTSIGLLVVGVFLSLLIASMVFYRLSLPYQISTRDLSATRAPETSYNQHDLLALKIVSAFCQEIESGKRSISSAEDLRIHAKVLLESLARHYYPKSKSPTLELGLADILAAIEASSRDLREFTDKNIPFHDTLSISNLLRAKKTFDLGKSVFALVQGASMIGNPQNRLLRSLAKFLPGKLISDTSAASLRVLLASAFEIVGKNSILLYRQSFHKHSKHSPAGSDDLERELAYYSETEALRVLVMGQTNAGKSSLINALFGDQVLSTSHLPQGGFRKELTLNLPGLGALQLTEAPGFQDAGTEERAFEAIKNTLASCDLLLLVIPATSAARKAESLLLDRIKEECRRSTREIPFFVCLSKIDMLRPLGDWNPPYNLVSPETHKNERELRKAQNIRDAVSTTAKDLGLETQAVVPLMLEQGSLPYNIDLLSALIQSSLPQAKQAMLRRVFARYLDEKELRNFEEALKRSGALLLRQGVKTVLQSASRIYPF